MQTLAQAPTDPAFVQNPYPFYTRARAAGDFVMWSDYRLPMATTQAAVSAVLKDRRLGRTNPAGLPDPAPGTAPFWAVEAHSMLELEPPRHTRLRGLVLRAFTSRAVQALAPQISEIADSLVSEFPPDASFDLLSAFAQRLPVIVIARFLGVPEAMADDLLRWSNAMVAMYQAGRTPETEAAAGTAAAEFSDFLRSYVKERRTRPADDLITALIAAEEDGARLSTDELISTCILLLNAGHEATVHTIGNGVRALLAHGNALEATQPERVAATVEEILRYDPPLHLFTRHVYEPVTILDHDFAPGDEIGCLLASAGRDDAVWPDAHLFDPARAVRPNLAFGAGIHFCVGAPLARLELQIALPLLTARCPDLALASEPTYANIYHFRGLERLLVSV